MALSVGLTACGGGGGGSTDTSMMPTPEEMCQADGGRYNADGTCTSAAELQIETLQAQIAALRTQLGIDASDDIGATIEELQNTLAALQKQVNDAADEAAMAAKKAAAADAEALFTGMDVDRGTANTVDLAVALTGTATVDGATVNLGVTDTHGDSAKVDATVDVDGAGAAYAAVKATDTMVPSLGVWQGTELAGANAAGTVSRTVTVYTDVGPNTPTPFDEVYGTSLTTTSTLVMDADESSDTHVGLIMASDFNHAGRMDHAPDAGTGDDQVTVRVDGTFHGARGQFQCTATGANQCVSHEDDNGVRLTGVSPSSAWEFVPGSNAMVSVADSTYLYFGWWLHKDSTGPEVDVFHGVTGTGLTDLVAADFSALSGTATYNGEAAGKYAIDPVAPGTYASGGHWTAKASLTADFGDQTGPGTISGMINNFMAGGDMMDWSIALGETALAHETTGNTAQFDSGANNAAEATTAVAGDDVVWTIAGEAAPEDGSWSGNLRDQGDNNVPTMATGEFSAVYSEGGHNIGHMAGAFGAYVE